MADRCFVKVDGLRLRVSVRGSGPSLLLLNGIGASLELLEPFRRAIRGHETIAVDLPGVGQSDTALLPMRFRGYARLVARALGVLRYDRVDILGVSWGGALAQEFAWRYPARVRRLVLAATTYGIPSVPGSPRTLWELATPRRYMSRSYFKKVAPALYGGVPDVQALVRELRLGHPPSTCGYAGQLFATLGWSSLPYLWRLRTPTLVIAGDRDPIIPLVNAQILSGLLPDARLHVVQGGGHLFLIVQADETAHLVQEFLAGQYRRGHSQ
jgi:poly(3-hydroxyoctanoate) depolymerase